MSTTVGATPARTTTKQRIGLALAGLFCLVNLSSAFTPTPDGEVGPPMAILVADSVLAAIGLVAVVLAWRSGSRAALGVLAGSMILTVLTAMPAFFVDVPAFVKAIVAASVVWVVASLVLAYSGVGEER